MPIPDDEQFETYLKQFRPTAPESLPTTSVRKVRTMGRPTALIATAAAIILLAIVGMRSQHKQVVTNVPMTKDGPTNILAKAPLTMRDANLLLVDAPSFKSAVNDLAFKSQRIPLAKNEQSAIHVLSKEKVKL